MNSNNVDDEILKVNEKLNELKKIKKDMEEINKLNNTANNLEIIKNSIEKRKDKVKNKNYSTKYCMVAYHIDKEMIDPLEAIYNVLFSLDNRLKILEDDIKHQTNHQAC